VQRGGGSASVVAVAAGVYLTGQVALQVTFRRLRKRLRRKLNPSVQTGVHLSVADDASIVGSHESRDYPLDPTAWALIFARAQDNIGIIGNLPHASSSAAAFSAGGGVIDGNYSAYIDHYDPGQLSRLKLRGKSRTCLNAFISEH
jgi:hypothetical protein